MDMGRTGTGRAIAGAGGALLAIALLLPWAEAGGVSRTGWELWTIGDAFLVIAGVIALLAGLTGGQFGLFRPDVSLIGATDIFGVVSAVVLGWLLLVDFPEGADREIGVYLALLGAIAMAGGAGDYSTLRGAQAFPRMPGAG